MGAKKKKYKEKTQSVESVKSPSNQEWYLQSKWHLVSIFLLSAMIYVNTLGHDYTQDDAIVIYDNMFTQQGISGIPGILKYDTFYGFFKEEGKAMLVSGGRYRPFTLILFAIEWQIFGRNPMIGHLINILFYSFLGIMIYKFLSVFLEGKLERKSLGIVALMVALIFVAHPIHTEAVANIKGRDEILSMLGSIMAFWYILKYEKEKRNLWQILAGIVFFLALMSKENAITFLAIVPIGLLLLRSMTFAQSIKKSAVLFLSAAVFLLVRFSVLGFDFGGTPNELMNNPFLKVVGNSYVDFSFQEKMATIFFTLGKYLQLMVFPHPLSHDYYPRAIDIMQLSDWGSLLSLLIYGAMVAGVFFFWKRDNVISFSLAFYLLSLSIVSNIIFPIGTNMSERFLFMPSLGLILMFVWLLNKYLKNIKLLAGLGLIVIFGLSAKTIDRNKVWQDDYTLFTSDVKHNDKSAKLLNAAGGAMTTRAATMADGPEKTQLLRQAIQYLEKAIVIHPNYRNAYLLLGNAYYYLQEFETSIRYLDKSLALDPGFGDALKNLPIVLRDGGRFMGQRKNDFVKAESWLLRSYGMNPEDYETCRLLGITYGIQGSDAKAIEYFLKAIELRPDIAANYSSLGTAYLNTGEKEKAREAFNKAVEIDPNALQHLNR